MQNRTACMKQDIVVGSSSCSAIVFCDRENKSSTIVYIKKREAPIFPTVKLWATDRRCRYASNSPHEVFD